jgi:hypothetical protein
VASLRKTEWLRRDFAPSAVSENVRSWSAMRPRIALIGANGAPERLSAAGFRLRDVTLYLLDVGAINGANQTPPAIVDVNLGD